MGHRALTSQRCTKTLVAMALCTSIAPAQEAPEATATLPTVKDPRLATRAEITTSNGDLIETEVPEVAFETARAAFWEAHRHFEAGKYETALALFEKSYGLFPQPELVFNIALTHERLGNCAAALETYDRYLNAPDARAANDSERAARNRAELAKRCEPPAALSPAIEPALLTAPLPAVTSAQPAQGATVLSDSNPAAAADSQLRTQLGWATLGAAVVSLGAVVYLDVRRRAAHSEYSQAKGDYEDNQTPSATDDMNRAEADFYRARTWEIALGVISGALAATGSALLLYDAGPHGDSAARGRSRAPAPAIGWAGAF